MRKNYIEIKNEEQLSILLNQSRETPICRTAFQNLVLPEEAVFHEYKNCLFLSCKMPHGLKRKLTDSLVFPNMGELFQFRSSLYTADSLYEGYCIGKPDSIHTCYDSRIYQHYIKYGKRASDIKETLARTLHDHSISNALEEFLSTYKRENIIGVMGGHGLLRTENGFEKVARISKSLTEHGKLMISGGGPGAMEATHLGAWMAGRSEEQFQVALNMLRTAPSFSDPLWVDTAMQVRKLFPQSTFQSVGIPTWLYGHEPATPLATHIAKYFDNSIREDNILTLSMGGIIYTPGSAGTLQEIFQDAVQNHYLSFGYASPMVFLDKEYWTTQVPIYPLIMDLVKKGRYKNLILSINDSIEETVHSILQFKPPCETT